MPTVQFSTGRRSYDTAANPRAIPLYDDRPFPNKAQSPAWQLALDHLEGVDRDSRFELAVAGMKMQWRVVVEEHPNKDPVESADCGHRPTASLPRAEGYSRGIDLYWPIPAELRQISIGRAIPKFDRGFGDQCPQRCRKTSSLANGRTPTIPGAWPTRWRN